MKSLLPILLVLLQCGMTFAQQTRPATPATLPSNRSAAVVQLEGEINDYSFNDLKRRFREAQDQGVGAIIVEIDSYGGLVTAGLETSRFIKQQQIPVVVFIKEKAISAGAMIALAADAIYMAPHASLGDAAPIAMAPGGGAQELGAAERAKIESPIVEDFRDSAQRNGYDPLLVEAMVVVGREVYYVQDRAGEKRFVSGEQWEKLQEEGGWEAVVPQRHPVDSKDSLLTLNSDTALKVGLARGLAASPDEVAARLGWKVVARFERTAGDRLIAFLSSMAVRSALITMLVIAIYIAINAPGHGAPEAIVVVCLGLLLGVPLMTGYAQWWEILLVVLGIVLLAVEIFITPGFGFIGITGILLILGGLVMTFVPKEPIEIPGVLPSLQATRSAFETGLAAVVGSLVLSLLVCFLLARWLPAMPLVSRLILTTTVSGETQNDQQRREATAEAVRTWIKPGDTGEALTDLYPGGTARFMDPSINDTRTIDVICDSGYVPAGSMIKVHEIAGSTIVVRKITPTA